MTAPTTIPLADLEARVPDGVGIDMPGPEGGWAVAVIGGRVYRARVAPVERAERGPCSHCPPGCGSCWPPDCECYTHQDWPDTRPDPVLAARLARCLDASGCDGHSHDITCNNALYGVEAEGES